MSKFNKPAPNLFRGQKIKTLFLVLFILQFNTAQVFSEKDVEICNSKFELAVDKNLSEKPLNEIIVEIGKSFIGTEYVAHTLEQDGSEQLVINLTGLDCTTFLETSLALARCIKSGSTTFEDYKKELIFIRYRDGIIDEYPSRLHYFSDWAYNNIKKEIVKDVTKELGGEEIKFNVEYMSAHPESYKHLKENPDFIPIIRKQEKEINERTYYYIPKTKVKAIETKIKTGDIIAITSSVKGLDINHVGFAVKMKDGKTHFMHAPQADTKVQITPEPLHEYLKKIKRHTGIIVLRVRE
jgi:hypothetical protein